MDKFESLEKAMCKELETIEQKVRGGSEMSVADLEKIDKLTHAMKSLATYKAMKGYNDEDDYNMSGRRRYMSGSYAPHPPYPQYPDYYGYR